MCKLGNLRVGKRLLLVDLIATLGHEITHFMDTQDGIFKAGDTDQNKYANNFGNDFAAYTNAALDYTHGTSLANTNTHTKPKSLESYLQLQQNNQEFREVGNTAVSHLVKQAGKETVKISIKGAILGGATDIYDNIEIDYSDVAVSSSIGIIAPSTITTLKTIPNSTTTLKEQLLKTKSSTKKQKLEQRINSHQQNIENSVVIVGGIGAIKTGSKAIANKNEEK